MMSNNDELQVLKMILKQQSESMEFTPLVLRKIRFPLDVAYYTEQIN